MPGPPRPSGSPCYFTPFLGLQDFSARLAVTATKFGRCRLRQIALKFLGFLAGRDPHNLDGVADHIGRFSPRGPRGIDLFALISENCAAPVTERTVDRSTAIAFIAFAAEHLIEDIPVIFRPSARRAGQLPFTLTV